MGNDDLYFSSSDINKTDNIYPIYYDLLSSCSSPANTLVLKNISNSNLTQIGSVYGIPVYKFSDPNNPILHDQYNNTIIDTEQNGEVYIQNNQTVNAPSYSEYVSKDPMLVIKDPFGRYIVVSEAYYYVPVGCGKLSYLSLQTKAYSSPYFICWRCFIGY